MSNFFKVSVLTKDILIVIEACSCPRGSMSELNLRDERVEKVLTIRGREPTGKRNTCIPSTAFKFIIRVQVLNETFECEML